MNEQKLLNGLKSVRTELTWNAIFFGIMYVAYIFILKETHDKMQWTFWIAFGCLIARTVISSFIGGYEKKI